MKTLFKRNKWRRFSNALTASFYFLVLPVFANKAIVTMCVYEMYGRILGVENDRCIYCVQVIIMLGYTHTKFVKELRLCTIRWHTGFYSWFGVPWDTELCRAEERSRDTAVWPAGQAATLRASWVSAFYSVAWRMPQFSSFKLVWEGAQFSRAR